MFDLPLPFGPTTTAMPCSKRSSTLPGNDLKPRMRSAFRYTLALPAGTLYAWLETWSRWSRASRAASCSEPFLLRAEPRPSSCPATRARDVNQRWCGGPDTSAIAYVTDAPRRASSSWSTVLWSTCSARAYSIRVEKAVDDRRGHRLEAELEVAGAHDGLHDRRQHAGRARQSVDLDPGGAQLLARAPARRPRARDRRPRRRSWPARPRARAPWPARPQGWSESARRGGGRSPDRGTPSPRNSSRS